MATQTNPAGMETASQETAFRYTYSAPRQEEVRKIREKYLPREESPMEQLLRLDKGAAQKGTALSLCAGTLGTMILGIGMCCCMVWGRALFVPGIVIGLLGLTGVCLAYPMYTRVTRQERLRIAPEVLRLTEELLK